MKQIDKANKQESHFNISDAVLDELMFILPSFQEVVSFTFTQNYLYYLLG